MANLTPTDVVAALAAILLIALAYNNRKSKRYPPGPPRWPIIGNVLDMPTHHFWEGFHQWAVKYSEDYILYPSPNPTQHILRIRCHLCQRDGHPHGHFGLKGGCN